MFKTFKTWTGLLTLALLTACNFCFAQTTTVSGTVSDKVRNEALAGVSVMIKGTAIGATTNEKGRFTLITSQSFPLTIITTYVGYTPIEQEITSITGSLTIELEQQTVLGQEVVISASRTPERILESPVSIERLGAAAIKELATTSFYDALVNLKGVESSAQSLTFKSINTRGFSSNGNTRLNQYLDGMDNQAPGLNFAVGNIAGISDLDVDNAELLPGASSALYGAGGINGTLLITSKNPFTSQGVSFQLKTGVNHVNDPAQNSQMFREANLRVAHAWNNKLAFKVNLSYLEAKDWQAANTDNYNRPGRAYKAGDRNTDPNYDGINVYGDEVNANMRAVAGSILQAGTAAYTAQYGAATGGLTPTQAQINTFLSSNPQTQPFYIGITAGLIPDQMVSRTGYAERSLVDYNTKSIKSSASVHYKLTNTIQAIALANWGTGTAVYTGADRFSLRNFNIGQYKLELKGQNFLVRGYTTQERSGDTYISSILGSYTNEVSKQSTDWFPEYIGNYVAARSAGADDPSAHARARSAADVGRFIPGSAEFETTKNSIINTNISSTTGLGARFSDRTGLWHYEGLYNFSNLLNNVIELQAGASYRLFVLKSGGTLFNDLNGPIDINEYGAFAQVGKKVFNDKLKLTLSGRFDKNMNFEGRFTPRITGVYTVAPNNNIRVSYQTGYRNPTTQNQYIDLSVGGGTNRLLGGLPASLNRYNLFTNKPYTDVSFRNYMAALTAGTPTAGLLQEYTFDPKGIRPESVEAIELGYKGLLASNLLFDIYGYYNTYKDFNTAVELYQKNVTSADPSGLVSPTKYNIPVNASGKVTSYGAAAGIDYIFFMNYTLSGNLSYNQIGDLPVSYINDFNTPKIRFNIGIANRELVKNVGFNVTYRWQDQFNWTSAFTTGFVPSFDTADAQINLKVPSTRSVIKLGGSNILNKYYVTSHGNPSMGGMYYLAFTYNP